MNKYLKFLSVFVLCLALVACKGKTLLKEDVSGQGSEEVVVDDGMVGEDFMEEDVVEEDAGKKAEYAELEPGDALTKRAVDTGELYTVHFDYDRYNIRDEDKDLLRKNAQWLKLNPDVNVLIEGHADERGENEYNLALGEKRAKSVKSFLNSLGVDSGRLSTISYGEEMPMDNGHGEEAWSKNRRAAFMIRD